MSEKFFVTLSPAKKFSPDPMPASLQAHASSPVFLEEADRLVSELRQLQASDLCRIMKISQDLGELNYNRYQQYQSNYHTPTHLAALSFAGDAFQSLSAHTLSTDTLIQSQACVGILSGLYGILKPLDAIQPYRLEMGCRPFPNKTLYSIWQKDLTEYLKNTLADGKFTCHLNCASQEYGSVLDTKQLGIPTCSLKFSVRQADGSFKVIGIIAKRARGAFVRFLLTKNPQSFDDLKLFSWQNFSYFPEGSSQEELHFLQT